MVCVCCVPAQQCCCDEEGIRLVESAEDCDGTTSPVRDTPIDSDDITISVDWDGLTIVLSSEVTSLSVSEAVSFSCLRPSEEEAFNATQRTLTAISFTGSAECYKSSVLIFADFIGKFPSNNFDAQSSSSALFPYVGECKLLAPVNEDDTSCTFIENISWCMDNPFSDTVTVELIIAP